MSSAEHGHVDIPSDDFTPKPPPIFHSTALPPETKPSLKPDPAHIRPLLPSPIRRNDGNAPLLPIRDPILQLHHFPRLQVRANDNLLQKHPEGSSEAKQTSTDHPSEASEGDIETARINLSLISQLLGDHPIMSLRSWVEGRWTCRLPIQDGGWEGLG